MLYLSKPNGTHAVFTSDRSQGAYDIVKLTPGQSYIGPRYPSGDFVGTRDFYTEACDWADQCDKVTARHG